MRRCRREVLLSHKEEKRQRELRLLFLTLWDKAVGTPTYDKEQWMRMEQLIGLNSPTSYPPPSSSNGSGNIKP